MPSDHLAQRLQRYFQGDTLAVEPLLLDSYYHQKIERLAQKNTQGTNLSWEDAAQEAKLKVLQAARNGKFRRGGVGEFYRWAATVALNAIMDLIRKDKRGRGDWYWQSLDQPIPGTDLPLGEAVADEFNLLERVEIADLVAKAREAVETLSVSFPKKQFEELWRGLVAGKTQCQLAGELGVSQAEVSKRRRELLAKVGNILGLLGVEKVEEELRRVRRGPRRKVCDEAGRTEVSPVANQTETKRTQTNRTGKNRTGKMPVLRGDGSGEDRTAKNRTGKNRTGKMPVLRGDGPGEDRTGKNRTGKMPVLRGDGPANKLDQPYNRHLACWPHQPTQLLIEKMEQLLPGQIWELNRSVRTPLELSPQDRGRLYPETARRFLAGEGLPRYALIVREPERAIAPEEPWTVLWVMPLSPDADRLSDIDVLIPSAISGMERDLLALTWQVLPMLSCNLSRPVGRRLSRSVCDLLWNWNNSHRSNVAEIQSLGLGVGKSDRRQQPEMEEFYRRESEFAAVLEVPVAAYRCYEKAIGVSEVLLDMAVEVEREFVEEERGDRC